MTDQLDSIPAPTPESQVRAGHTGHGRVLFEGDLLDALTHNRNHVGASRVWCGVVAMTLPKMPFSRAVQMADNVLEQAAYVAAKLADGTNAGSGVTPREARRARTFGSLRRKTAPRHAHQDPKGAECLAALTR